MYTVQLTEEEVAERAQSMAQVGKKIVELEEREEGVKAEYKRTMADIKEQRIDLTIDFKKLMRAVSLKVEERDGQQQLFEDYKKAKKPNEPTIEEQQAADVEVRAQEQRIEAEENRAAEEAVRLGEHPFSEVDEEKRKRIHAEAIARWRREPLALNAAPPNVIDAEVIEENDRCQECDTLDGHRASCSQYDFTSGTPIETELPADEIQRLAEFNCCDKTDQIDKGTPLKTVLINGNPYLVTGSMSQYSIWWQVDASPVLPMANVGEENTRSRAEAYAEYEARTDTEPMSLIRVRFNAGTKKKPDWWVVVGERKTFKIRQRSQHSFETLRDFAKTQTTVKDPEKEALRWYETGEQDKTVTECLRMKAEKADDFTAPRCEECKRTDGGHGETCSHRNMISYATYFAFAQAKKLKNPASHARMMELKRDRDEEVRAWIEAEQGSPDPEKGELFNNKPKPKRNKKRIELPEGWELDTSLEEGFRAVNKTGGLKTMTFPKWNDMAEAAIELDKNQTDLGLAGNGVKARRRGKLQLVTEDSYEAGL